VERSDWREVVRSSRNMYISKNEAEFRLKKSNQNTPVITVATSDLGKPQKKIIFLVD